MGLFGKKPDQNARQARGSALGRNRAVYSYYQKRADTSDNSARRAPAEYKKTASKSRFGFLKSVPAIICSIVFVLFLGYMTMLTPKAKVKIADEKSPGTVLLQEPAVYEQAAERVLKHSPLSRSKVTINTS